MIRVINRCQWRLAALVGGLTVALMAFTSSTRADEAPLTGDTGTDAAIVAMADGANVNLGVAAAADPGEDFDEDPWEGFNEKVFNFNREVLDRFLLKPIATAWRLNA